MRPDWHQHMWAFTPLPLPLAWPCLGWPQQPLPAGRAVLPGRKKGVVSFRGFARGAAAAGQAVIFKLVRRGEAPCEQRLLHLLLAAQ